VHLTKEEEGLLRGEEGSELAEVFEAVVKVAEVLGATRLVKVSHAHISGISYRNLGVEGVEFLEDLASRGLRFAVPTTINPAGFDLSLAWEMGVRPWEYELQMRALRALSSMGAEMTLTCTPYLLRTPCFGEHLAWAESNAVLYANSVLGARTNREGGPLSVLEALVGRAPYVGLHTEEGRRPTVVVDASRLRDLVDKEGHYAALGYLVGELVRSGVPALRNPPRGLRAPENLKLFLAALGASSSVGLVLIEGVSPEYEAGEGLETLRPGEEELRGVAERWALDDFDHAVLGCPHLSPEELVSLAQALSGVSLKKEVLAFTSRWSAQRVPEAVESLRKRGVKVYYDTCMVVGNLSALGVRKCATDSAKAAYYLAAQGYEVALMPRSALLRAVAGG